MSDQARCQEAALRFLADPAAHRLNEPVKRVDTAGAVVFLAGPDVYKVKRAVAFPFMDLSTLEKRREACEAEIAVNRENAPGVYLDARPIVRTPAGLAIGGEGEAVEWVCHMRRFDENATLDRIAERDGLSDALIDKLARAVLRSAGRHKPDLAMEYGRGDRNDATRRVKQRKQRHAGRRFWVGVADVGRHHA